MGAESLDKQTMQQYAWIGDAVLALFAREWILQQSLESNEERTAIFIHLTSNQFLSTLAEPTRVEAEIGLIYQQQGIQSAFHFIRESILPLFFKQLPKRKYGKSLRML